MVIIISSPSKQALENQTSILNATVCQREKFIQLIEDEIRLQLVEIPHWAGLGGVCYIPPGRFRCFDFLKSRNSHTFDKKFKS